MTDNEKTGLLGAAVALGSVAIVLYRATEGLSLAAAFVLLFAGWLGYLWLKGWVRRHRE